MLRYWEKPAKVKSPDGRTYAVQLVAAWMGPDFDPRNVFFGGPLLHLVWVALGRAWRVEVTEEGPHRLRVRKWLPEPYIDVVTVKRSRRTAEAEAREVLNLILTRGWVKGVTYN